ncbi:MAG: MotA/TolQ/ExbB proton channel family protein [Betaproteobacteria bacterium]|nr:MotA/TolQ/ExbB proton channel family protein [Betaproteobacteria bacterium]
MQNLSQTWTALKLGGIVIVPLSLLAVIALAVIIEKAFLYWRYARMPQGLRALVESYGFEWQRLEHGLSELAPGHYYRRFLRTVLANRAHPAWWTESRAADEAQLIETALGRRLWMLETIVTAAPLMGLLGTILGMMHAFQLIGSNGLVDPAGVTGGVAQALIATAFGLLIALISLFGFNYFSRLQAQALDEMERLGTRLVDRIRLDQEGHGREAA